MGDQATGGHKECDLVMGYFLILPIKMVHSGVLFMLFCTVNWHDVQGLNIEVGGLTSDVEGLSPCALPHFNHCMLLTSSYPSICLFKSVN